MTSNHINLEHLFLGIALIIIKLYRFKFGGKAKLIKKEAIVSELHIFNDLIINSV